MYVHHVVGLTGPPGLRWVEVPEPIPAGSSPKPATGRPRPRESGGSRSGLVRADPGGSTEVEVVIGEDFGRLHPAPDERPLRLAVKMDDVHGFSA
jgi:hypothetical protein